MTRMSRLSGSIVRSVSHALTPDLLSKFLAVLDQAVANGARDDPRHRRRSCLLFGRRSGGRGGIVPDLGETLEAWYHPLMMRLAALDIPVVSVVNGPAVGAGVALALAGDIVMMARSAYLQLGFVNIGLVPDAGATWLIAKSAGRAKALEMALLGERMSAQDAQDCGLVARVVDDEALFDEALAIAQKLAEGPGVAIGLIRKQVAAALNLTQAETLALEAANQSEAGRTADFREARGRFPRETPTDVQGLLMTGKPTTKDWAALAAREVKGADLDWHTPEGIVVRPLYAPEDLGSDAADPGLPGFAPYTRGVRATMYAGRAWTIRQYAGFSTAEDRTPSTGAIWLPGRRGSASPSISQPTAATTAIILACMAMSARRAWRSTRSRT